MGANIPLPALSIKPPESPVSQFSQLLQLRNLMNQGQMQKEQLVGAQQENQMRGMQIQDQQTIQKLAPQYIKKNADGTTGYDYDGLEQGAIAAGVRPQSLQQLQALRKNQTDLLVAQANAGKINLENFNTMHDQARGKLEAFRNAPADQKQSALNDALNFLQKNGEDISQYPKDASQVTPQMLDSFEARLAMGSQIAKEAQERAEANKAASQGREADVNANLAQQKLDMMKQFGGMTPDLIESKYVSLAAKRQQGQPLSADDAAFMKGVEKYKSIVPQFNFNVQNGGVTGQNGQPSALAQAVANGQMKWGDVISPRTPMSVKTQFAKEVRQINPNFNSGDFEVEQAVRKDFTSGTDSNALNSINRAREHMQVFLQTAKDLDNGNVQAFNRLGQALATEFGSDKAGNLDIAKQAFSSEVGKAFAGANVALGDRKEIGDRISAASSFQQLAGVARTADSLLAGAQKVLQQKYNQGIQGKPNFEQGSGTNHPFFSQFGGTARQ